MAKVSDLTEMTAIAAGDDLYVVDDVLSRKITAQKDCGSIMITLRTMTR